MRSRWSNRSSRGPGRWPLVVSLALLPHWAAAQTAPAAPKQVPVAGANAASAAHTRYLPNRFAGRAGQYYRLVWGVDALSVRLVESGELLRFSWQVLDPHLAQALSDKRAQPALIDPAAGVSLVVPAVENVGQLRQTPPPEAGRSYWMAFSNRGHHVKRGDHVTVVIGGFRAEGLGVD